MSEETQDAAEVAIASTERSRTAIEIPVVIETVIVALTVPPTIKIAKSRIATATAVTRRLDLGAENVEKEIAIMIATITDTVIVAKIAAGTKTAIAKGKGMARVVS